MSETASTPAPGNDPTGDAPNATSTARPTPSPPPANQQGLSNIPSVADLETERDRWKHHAQTHERKWQKANGDVEQARRDVADRELALTEARSEAARGLALAQLQVGLARAGMAPEAADNYTKFLDPGRLLKDGAPNPEAIAQLVAELPASLRAGPPDPDQGRASSGPTDMNSLVRRMAGFQ